jgi:predicted RNA binding protein YcfA (HicA-like mRNA interferase family)
LRVLLDGSIEETECAKIKKHDRFLASMPQKVRELKQQLTKIGFQKIPGKGSHTNWIHPLYAGKLTLSGKDGSDAKPYQEKAVNDAIEEVLRKKIEE